MSSSCNAERVAARLRQELARAGCVLYVSAEWTESVDKAVLPNVLRLVQQLHDTEPIWHAVTLHRDANLDADAACRESDGRYAMGARCFQALCRDLAITRLPACIMVDEHLQDEEHPSGCPRSESDNAVLQELRAVLRRIQQGMLPRDEETTELSADNEELVQQRDHALSLFNDGLFIDAAKSFVDITWKCPTCTKSQFNLAIILQTLEEHYFAVAPMLQVVRLDDRDAVAHTVLRSVLYPHEPELVIAGYEAILKRSPDHVRARHSLATLTGDALTSAPEYVQQVFDDLAETFEEKLVSRLDYRVPWQLKDALQRSHALSTLEDGQEYRALDLGCGTGLCGRLLRPFVSYMIGVSNPICVAQACVVRIN